MKELSKGQKIGLFIFAVFAQGVLSGDTIKAVLNALSTFTWGPQ